MKLVTIIIFSVAVLLGVFVAYSPHVAAHVLLKSNDGSKGAILHIMPDDDPIAGETAQLMLDTQGSLMSETSKVSLSIDDGQIDIPVKTNIKDSLISASYIFPSQGTYGIKYVIENQGTQYMFESSLRVSRGVVTKDATPLNRYPWANALLFLTAALFILLLIILWNHRQEISKFSKL